MKVTVTLGSSRPGGIDISLAGLAAQTFEDFEVVFVDARYHQRHRQVLEAVRRSGLKQPFYHVPNHRFRDDDLGTTSAGYNTGFMLAAGEIVVMLMDYAYAPPLWLSHHVAYQDKSKIILGPHEYRTLHGFVTKDGGPVIDFLKDRPSGLSDLEKILAQREKFDEISIFEKPFTADQLDSFPIEPEPADTKCSMPTGPLSWLYFNTKNESFPLQAILDVNGMDENCDRACIPGDHDLCIRLERHLSSTPWNVREAVIQCLNPRRILPRSINVMAVDQPLPPPYENYWPLVPKGYAYLERVKTDNSIIRAPNPFDIRKRREEIWHWRELGLNEDTIIPKNMVPDRDYYSTSLESQTRRTMAPHMYDPRTQLNHIVWHNDPSLEAFVRHLIETVNPDRWVETGTHMGWTSMWVAQNYPDLPIYTAEVDRDFYEKSVANLKAWPQVSVVHDHSPNFLAKLLPFIRKGLSIFWLDAHWWPPVPLRDECKIVALLDRYICLLDDFSCWQPNFEGDVFFTIPPSGGDAYLNDITYVCSELGKRYYRSNYEPKPGFKGVGLFMKNVGYVPPPEYMKEESLETALALRPADCPYPIYPIR